MFLFVVCAVETATFYPAYADDLRNRTVDNSEYVSSTFEAILVVTQILELKTSWILAQYGAPLNGNLPRTSESYEDLNFLWGFYTTWAAFLVATVDCVLVIVTMRLSMTSKEHYIEQDFLKPEDASDRSPPYKPDDPYGFKAAEEHEERQKKGKEPYYDVSNRKLSTESMQGEYDVQTGHKGSKEHRQVEDADDDIDFGSSDDVTSKDHFQFGDVGTEEMSSSSLADRTYIVHKDGDEVKDAAIITSEMSSSSRNEVKMSYGTFKELQSERSTTSPLLDVNQNERGEMGTLDVGVGLQSGRKVP